MKARHVMLLLCPALLSCSLWMKLDKSKLGYSDAHVDVEEEFPPDMAPDIPEDMAWDGTCPDAPECASPDDCNDDDPCTIDFCYLPCGACLHPPIDGAMPTLEDIQLGDMEERSNSPPRVSWTGTEYGVVWGYGVSTNSGEIYFATVSEDGSTHTSTPVRITDDGLDDVRPRIAWSGSEWAIAWVHYPGVGGQVLISRVTPGFLDHTSPSILFETDGNMASLDIVWTEDRYGIAYDYSIPGSLAMMFSILEPDGAARGTPTTVDLETTFMSYPSLAWSGSEYGLAWQDSRGGDMDNEIYFARLEATGELIGLPAPVVSTSSMNEMPSLAWSGIGYAVAYHKRTSTDPSDIYFQPISPTGSPQGPERQLTSSPESFDEFPSLTFTGSEYGLVYNGNGELHLIRMASDGSPVGDVTRFNTHEHPAEMAAGVVWNGSRYAVSWQGTEGEWFNLLGVCPF